MPGITASSMALQLAAQWQVPHQQLKHVRWLAGHWFRRCVPAVSILTLRYALSDVLVSVSAPGVGLTMRSGSLKFVGLDG